MRTQTIALRKGWNSVFLQVTPAEADPKVIFANVPVDTVATFFRQTQPAAYIKNPGDAPWREEGWGVWYAANRPDAFLSSLHAIHGHQGYLIHATEDYLWRITGTVRFQTIRWQPDTYNFTGFPVDPVAPPTFEEYFAGSPAHRGQRIFRLVDGVWTPVQDPGRTPMRAGEGYWVYCKGGSDFQGPLKVKLPSAGVLHFGPSGGELRLDVVNQGVAPADIALETVTTSGNLPLVYQVKDLSTLSVSYPPLPSKLNLPKLAPGAGETVRLAVRRDGMADPRESVLLRITNRRGIELWVPVEADRAR